MNVQHDNIKAGLFVLVGIVLALVIVFTLSDLDRWIQRRQTVAVYYPLVAGLQGLKEGAAVTLGDQPVGEVTTIDDVTEDQMTPGGDPTRAVGKRIVISIPTRYKIYWNAKIELSVPTIGTGTKLNVRSVGSGEAYDPQGTIPSTAVPPGMLPAGMGPADVTPPNQPPLATYTRIPNDAIPGAAPTSPFIRSLGIDEQQRDQIRHIIANIESLTTTLSRDAPQITGSAKKILTDIEPVTDDAKAMMADLRTAAADVKAVTADVRQQSKTWMARIVNVTLSAQETLARAQKMLEDKDPQLRQIIDDVAAVTKIARQKTIVQVTEALDKADAALANMQHASEELNTFIIGQRPVLEHAMANFQITSAQLKLASIEVRRSPWRLLYQPTDKELEYDNLYDAARSFALAAGALDAAAQNMRAVAENDPAGKKQIGPMLDHLQKLFTSFKQTEDKFWQAMDKEAKKAGE